MTMKKSIIRDDSFAIFSQEEWAVYGSEYMRAQLQETNMQSTYQEWPKI